MVASLLWYPVDDRLILTASMCSRRLLCVLAPLAILTLVWNVGLAFFFRESSLILDFRDKIATELGPIRPTAARLVGLQYAPWEAGNSKVPSDKLRKIWQLLGKSSRKTNYSSGEGLLKLIEGKPEEAAEILADSLAESLGASGVVLSDLSAAHLACQGDPIHLLFALDAADRAVKANPSLHEARYNLALSLEHLYLLNKAREAWNDYLKLDTRSLWAQEARRHLGWVEEQLKVRQWNKGRAILAEAISRGEAERIRTVVARFPDESREYAEEDLIAKWAVAKLRNQENDASELILKAKVVANALVESNSGYILTDALSIISRLPTNDSITTASLVRGHLAYREARALYGQHRSGEAFPLLQKANIEFGAVGSPFEMWAKLYLAVIHYEGYELHKAMAILEELERRSGIERYPELLGRIYWVKGLLYIVGGEPMKSLDAYFEALSVFGSVHENGSLAAIHNLLAENYRHLGQYKESWRHLSNSLAVTSKLSDFRRVHAILDEAAEIGEKYLGSQMALYFRDEIAHLAINFKEPTAVSHALLRRGESRLRNGERLKAYGDLAQANYYWRRISDVGQSARVGADLAILRANFVLATRPEESVTLLTRALDFYRFKGNELPVGHLYLLRSRARIALGDYLLAEDDLEKGIVEFERQRSSIIGERFRISFFDQAQEAFDEMIMVQAKVLNRHERALDYSEQKRARVLLDRIGFLLTRERRREILSRTISPLNTKEMISRIPEGSALVQYCVMSDVLLMWVVRSEGVRFFEVNITHYNLKRLVSDLESSLIDVDSFNEASLLLYDSLVRPIRAFIGDVHFLVFVPDKTLHRVPFAALMERERRRYLIEDYAIAVSPSATHYLSKAHSYNRERSPANSLNALVVGSSSSKNSSLQWLAKAESEAVDVSSMYPESAILVGDRVTKKAVLSMISRYDVVHFSGHAVINGEQPLFSYLAMGSSAKGSSEVLYAHELYKLNCEHLALVVLAACETASGPTNGEGVMSLARSFLATGAFQVIASLWQVEDSMAERFFTAFHASYVEKGDAVAALREVQLAWIKAERVEGSKLQIPANWAGFQSM